MYDYTVYPDVSEKLFYEQCRKIERQIDGLRKQELLKTFDDTLIQIYLHPLGKIMVKNDELTGALYVQSDIDLERFDALLRVKK